jgi:hypothetical protein
MSSKRLSIIRDNFELYNKLLEGRKSVFSEVIDINDLGNNANTLEKIEPVQHSTITDDMVLIVDVKVNNHNFFQFKLRYKTFVDKPFFRFDSDGATHHNKIDGTPLHLQAVKPPHFHKFNADGIEIAYQTDKLLNETESKALEDINLCIAYFFQESNTRLNQDEFPIIKILPGTLGFSFVKEDPNQNVTFP